MNDTKNMPSQVFRANAPELDPLRIGTGWKPDDLGKIQVFIESTFGDSHPGSGHLNKLVEAAREGVREAGGVKGEKKTPEEMDAILAERKKNWQPKPMKYKRGAIRLFAEHAVSPMRGAYLDFD